MLPKITVIIFRLTRQWLIITIVIYHTSLCFDHGERCLHLVTSSRFRVVCYCDNIKGRKMLTPYLCVCVYIYIYIYICNYLLPVFISALRFFSVPCVISITIC